ncbi:MAG: hypothetical protein IJM18_08900 [Clostridia bacterium]|nr:hypothetical protein [Clostridia bacterium]
MIHEEYLKQNVKEGMTLFEAARAFAEMCRIPMGEEDMLLFETGAFSPVEIGDEWEDISPEELMAKLLGGDDEELTVCFVRQVSDPGDPDEYLQLHLEMTFPRDEDTEDMGECIWSDDAEPAPGESVFDAFFRKVGETELFRLLKDKKPESITIFTDET